MPQVVSIAYTPANIERKPEDHYARASLDQARLIANRGLEGDVKGRAGDRQLNVMRAEDVAELRAEGYHTGPGELGEQLVIAGLDTAAFEAGTRLRLGETAVVEIVMLREGCDRFEHIQGHPKEASAGRIGAMARVVQSGDIAVGSQVTVEAPVKA